MAMPFLKLSMRPMSRFFLPILWALLVPSCSDGTVCSPGVSRICTCGLDRGLQQCNASGTDWLDCSCDSSDAATDPDILPELEDPVEFLEHCSLGSNVLYLAGTAGDFIHPGAETLGVGIDWAWSSTTWDWGMPGEVHTVELDITSSEQRWHLDLSSRAMGTALAVGLYDNAMRYTIEDPGFPGLWVAGNGRGCNRLSGMFQIFDIAFDPTAEGTPELIRISAVFRQNCEEGSDFLLGCVVYER